MITILCNQCRKKVFKYRKIGEGRVLKCYKSRISKDYSQIKEGNVYCKNGHFIGHDEGRYIKMKQAAFSYSGVVEK